MNENLAALDVPGVEVLWAEERLDSDIAGLGVVDGGRGIRVDDVRVGLGVVDAVPGLGVEDVGEADPDAAAAASDTEATSGVL